MGSVPPTASILKNSLINQRKYFKFMIQILSFIWKNRQRAIYNRFYDIFIPSNPQENVIQITYLLVVQNGFEKLVSIMWLLYEFHYYKFDHKSKLNPFYQIIFLYIRKSISLLRKQINFPGFASNAFRKKLNWKYRSKEKSFFRITLNFIRIQTLCKQSL